jgi:hypothetical protein
MDLEVIKPLLVLEKLLSQRESGCGSCEAGPVTTRAGAAPNLVSRARRNFLIWPFAAHGYDSVIVKAEGVVRNNFHSKPYPTLSRKSYPCSYRRRLQDRAACGRWKREGGE